MSSVNKAILVGNLGREPEVKTLQNGGKVCNFTMATSERWKDKTTGEQKEKTEWHRIVVWNDGLVSVCERFLAKGSKVYVEGKIESRKFQDQQGNERQTSEIVLKGFDAKIVMLDGKNAESGQPQSPGNAYQQAREGHDATGRSAPVQSNSYDDDFGDSEIPF